VNFNYKDGELIEDNDSVPARGPYFDIDYKKNERDRVLNDTTKGTKETRFRQ
jgi:hypothetical protein